MELVYSAHAVERMQQRKISPSDVENIIFNCDGMIKQSKDKTIFYKKIKGRKDNTLAAVVVEKKRDLLEVLTVMIHFEVKK
ncbi:MAG: DUF4258 domain-containing protein [Bdellovibrionales bacterium]|nr:DUF4258 domain-containing protein [Bdellovibrionales bacterium]